MHYNGQTSAH